MIGSMLERYEFPLVILFCLCGINTNIIHPFKLLAIRVKLHEVCIMLQDLKALEVNFEPRFLSLCIILAVLSYKQSILYATCYYLAICYPIYEGSRYDYNLKLS